LFRASTIESLAHLGEYGFEDVAAAGAFSAMVVLSNSRPSPEHRITALLTLDEARAILDRVGGKPLSEIILEMRGPKA
jgi:hypothetical protein